MHSINYQGVKTPNKHNSIMFSEITMKKASLALMIGAALVVTACGSDKKETAPAEEQAAANASASTYSTTAEQHSYALGASMGMFAKNRLDQQQQLEIEVDQKALIAGFNDALAGTPAFTDAEIQQYAQASDQELRDKQAAAMEENSAQTIAEGEAFLAENAQRDGVETTDSGLQYEVITEGTGKSPKAVDTVKVHYKGTLINGEQFDSSYDRGEPTSFPLNRVISGWTEGLQLMKEGAKYRFFIPSEIAYGARAAGSIPPHSTLIFDVELLEVTPVE